MRYGFLVMALVACSGDKDAGNTGDTGTTPGDDDDDDDTGATGAGFSIEGIVIDFGTNQPSTLPDLCVDLIDPSPLLDELPPLTLQTATVGAGGVFNFPGVVTTSLLGLLMSVKDCATPGATVYTTATGILPAAYAELGDGDLLQNQVAISIDLTTLGGLEQSATAAGYATDLGDDGFLLGFAFDSARTPLSGITVAGGAATWYFDTDPLDGAFTTTGAPNTATDAAAGGAWLIPAAGISSYSATDATGTYTFDAQLNGSNPGSATVTAFVAL